MYKYFLLTILVLTLFNSCKKMDDIYREFYEKGETVYVGKADSIKVKGGRERVELSWLLLSDPKVTGYKVYWNNRKDSVQNSVIKTAGIDTVKLLLSNMPEDIYLFEIYMFDKDRNSSILSSAIGKSYGQFYQNSILNRTFKSSRRITAGAEITWTAAAQDLLFVDLSYIDKSGNTISKLLSRSVEVDTLYNIPVRGTFQYRSAYIPEPNALDTFYTNYRTVTLSN